MAIQQLDINREPKRNEFAHAFGRGLDVINEYSQMKKKEAANKSIQEQFGFDPTGMTDKQVEIGMQLAGQARNKENEIEFKHNKRQELLNSIQGGRGSNQDVNMSELSNSDYSQDNEENPFAKAAQYAAIGEHDLSQVESKNAQEKLREKREHTKQVTESYKENKDYINKVYDQYEDTNRKEAILSRMNELNESGELSDSGAINALEALGMKPEWLKNPSNEEYTKLALDLLGGGTLQADYGSRVLASEFKVSQQRIPSLNQTPEGRRQIAENIQTLLLPAKLKEERMKYYLEKAERTGKPLPHNLRGKVLQDIKPQLDEAYDKFKQRNGRYKVKSGSTPDDNAIEKYYYISDGNEDKALKMMAEDGYVIY